MGQYYNNGVLNNTPYLYLHTGIFGRDKVGFYNKDQTVLAVQFFHGSKRAWHTRPFNGIHLQPNLSRGCITSKWKNRMKD